MTFQDFLNTAKNVPVGLRTGQHLYNTLAKVRPDIADVLMETGLDPFYDDNRVPAAIATIKANW